MDKKLKSLRESYTQLYESGSNNLIIVDVQPEYENYISFDIEEFCEWLNENADSYDKVIFFWNGPELGMVEEYELTEWFYSNGLEEDVVSNSTWYDKGYAFFRYCIDEGIDDDDIVSLIKFMWDESIYDSRDIDDEVWKMFIEKYGESPVRELLQGADDLVSIPDLMDKLKNITGTNYLCGGGANECLKEVEIALLALDKEIRFIEKWVY